jgi:hypothetical protein
MQPKIRITVQVLNGATGEGREVIAHVSAKDEQEAVNLLFSKARKDDFYYRFLGHNRVIDPTIQGAVKVIHQTMTYWALEG